MASRIGDRHFATVDIERALRFDSNCLQVGMEQVTVIYLILDDLSSIRVRLAERRAALNLSASQHDLPRS